MGLSLIGAGFGRTGTLSIKLALEAIGFTPCYHMQEVFTRPGHLERWRAVASGEPADWDSLFAGYKATVDWPGTLYWRDLADAYPKAKVLLSIRPAERWFDSLSKTVTKLIGMRDSFDQAHLRAVLDYAHEIIVEQTFGGTMHDRTSMLTAYQRRIDEVVAQVDADRLLVFDVTEGWAPLCGFLGVPEPVEAFPRVNDSQEFWQRFGPG